MADFDEISRTLGRIEGTVKATSDQVTALFDKHDKVNEEVIEQRGAIKLLATQQAETKIAVDDYKAVKNRGLGAMWGIGLTSGSLGAGLATLLGRMVGKS